MRVRVKSESESERKWEIESDRKKDLRFRGGLVFKAPRLCVPLKHRLESNKEEEKKDLYSM